jgi:hypothetical protein
VGWDASRPVPWRRLTREWLIYAGIMAVVFLLFFRGSSMIGIIGGLLISGPLYLAFGYVLAKLGYQRKTLKEMRTPRAEPAGQTTRAGGERTKPPPTRRTSPGTNRRAAPSRKRR